MDANKCEVCGAPTPLHRSKPSPVWRRHCSEECKEAALAKVEAAVGGTGLTETNASIRRRLGYRPGQELRTLLRQGRVQKIGARYFPNAWLPGGAVSAASPSIGGDQEDLLKPTAASAT